MSADSAAYVARHDLAVAREDLHRDAVGPKPRDRLRSGVLGRIQERDVAGKHEVGFIGRGVGRPPGGQRLARDCDDAEAVLVQALLDGAQGSGMALVARHEPAAQFGLAACADDLFDCSLADQQMRAALAAHDDRHAPTLEVERNLVDLGVPQRRCQALLDLCMLEHGHIQQVAQP